MSNRYNRDTDRETTKTERDMTDRITAPQLVSRIASDLGYGMPASTLAEEIRQDIGAGSYDYSVAVLNTAHRCLARLDAR